MLVHSTTLVFVHYIEEFSFANCWFFVADVQNLSVEALGNQASASRVCRNVPAKDGITGASDLTVLTMLVRFLADNRNVLKKIATNQLGFGTLDSVIKGISDVTEKLFGDFPGFLKNTLYGLLWNTNADTAPAGWTYDKGLQDIINWALVNGTGTTAETGGYSILGPNAEGFLPALADPNVGILRKRQKEYLLWFLRL